MRRKIVATAVTLILVALSSGASCRQETAQNVLATFLNTLAESVAQQIVANTAKSAECTQQFNLDQGGR